MTQEQFNTIVKIIRNGAPALSEELVSALANLIGSYQKQATELEQFKNPDKTLKESNNDLR